MRGTHMHTQCGTCGETFTASPVAALHAHAIRAHLDRLQVRTYETGPDPVEYCTLQCEVCGESFQRTALQYRTLVYNMQCGHTKRVVCSKQCGAKRM